MKTEKLGQGSAFPYPSEKCKTDDQGRSLDLGHRKSLGMSQRLYLAGMAMQGLLANEKMADAHDSDVMHWIAKHALEQADELLKQEAE